MKFIETIIRIKGYIQFYLAVVSVIGAIWGAFTIYNNWKTNNKEMEKSVKLIMKSQVRQGQIDSIKIQMDNIESSISSLQISYVNYISNDKTLTKQDFLRYMEGLSLDVKKKSLTSEMIPFLLYQK
jgi:pimeloyl-CoA synthetase